MVRKMAYVGFFYLIGLFFASFINFKLDITIAVGLAIIGTAYALLINRKNLTITVCMLTLAASLSIYGMYEAFVYNPILEYAGKTALIQGKIVDIQYFSDDKAVYTVKGKLGKYRGYFGLYCDILDCEYYDEISATGVMNKFEDTYSFPAESVNKAKGIFLQMTEPAEIKTVPAFSVRRAILKYRDYLYDKIITILPNEEGKALVAILCGDKNGLENDTKTLLFRSGIGHIMSVSGSHLAIVTSFLVWVLKAFSVKKWFKFLLLESVAFSFVVFAGMSESVIRSAIMISIVYGADLFKKRADTFNSLGISVIILTLCEPFAIRDASFVLSVTGVLGIGVAAPAFTSSIKATGIKGKLIKSLVTMLSVTITVFPVSFLFFNEISIISPVTNMLLIPFCSFALICGVIIAFTGGLTFIAFPLLIAAGLCCKVVLAVSRFIGNLNYAYVPSGYGFIEACITASILALILSLVIFKNRKAVLITVVTSIFSLIICTLSYRIVNMDTLSVAVLGDLQSSSLIIYKGNQACIIDLNGGRKQAAINCKYLQRAGIREIALLALNSNTQQTMSAYENRFKLFNVKEVLLPEEEYYLENSKILGVVPERINVENASVDMGSYKIDISTGNTVKVTYGDFSILCVNAGTEYGCGSEGYSVVVFYDSGMLPINGGYFITLDEDRLSSDKVIKGSALVTCKNSGQIKVRRITNGSRQ